MKRGERLRVSPGCKGIGQQGRNDIFTNAKEGESKSKRVEGVGKSSQHGRFSPQDTNGGANRTRDGRYPE